MTPETPSAAGPGPLLIVMPPTGDEAAPDPAVTDWMPYRASGHHDAIAVLRLTGIALVCLATTLPDAAAAAIRTAIAAMPAPPPILEFDPAPPFPDPARLQALATRPVPPPASDPLTRLTALIGTAGITQLLTAFRERLRALIAAPDPYAIGEGTTPAALAHRMGGLAGTLDFAPLSIAWLRVETDGNRHLPHAWDETRIAIAMLDRLLAGRDG